MASRDQLYEKLTEYLVDLFEIPAEKITPQAKLFEELDLDSIDAVDLIVKLQEFTGRRVKPEDFKAVRTVKDVVDCLERLLATDDIPA